MLSRQSGLGILEPLDSAHAENLHVHRWGGGGLPLPKWKGCTGATCFSSTVPLTGFRRRAPTTVRSQALSAPSMWSVSRGHA